MNRMRRIAGMGKSKKAPSAVQKDKDESIVFFRELYKHEKDTDVNLLEPIYSVEFDAIQGGHMSKPPPGKRDLLVQINEKHDYDWPKAPPAAPMFPSLKMEEAGSSETVVPILLKELPIPIAQPVKPSASRSRFVGKTEAGKAPAGSSSGNYAKSQPCTTDRRPASAYASTLPNRQQKASTGTSISSGKAHSHMYYANASQGSASATNAAETPGEAPYTAPKNLLTTGSVFARRGVPSPATTMAARARWSRGPPLGVDAKVESGKARRSPCPPAAAAKELLQVDGRKNALPDKGKAASTGVKPVCSSVGRAVTSKITPAKGMPRTNGKSERRPRFADQ
ncbi:hypothetical protein ZWY2020_048263 [Hordeum vulgare]|nr:hypothetical protein ZWY2020_048263 [Hordeum vulgare]